MPFRLVPCLFVLIEGGRWISYYCLACRGLSTCMWHRLQSMRWSRVVSPRLLAVIRGAALGSAGALPGARQRVATRTQRGIKALLGAAG